MRFSLSVLFTYIFIFYLTPLFLYFGFGGHANFIPFVIGYEYFIFFLLFFGTWFFSYLVFVGLIKVSVNRVINIFKFEYLWLCISFVSMVVGFYFKLNYGLDFRQSGDKLSDSGIIPKLVFLLKPVAISYFVYHMFCYHAIKQTGVVFLSKVLFLFFMIFTLIASFEMLIISLVVFQIVSVKGFYRVFYSRVDIGFFNRYLKLVLLVMFGLLILSGVVFVGIANKTGMDDVGEYFSSNDVVSKLLYYLYYRLSIFNSSLAIYVSKFNFDFDLYFKSISIVAESFLYRVSILVGAAIERPELTNMNRLNYETIFVNLKDKEIGASPGVFASFSMLMPAYAAAILSGLYFSFISKVLNGFVVPGNQHRFSMIAVFLMIYYMFPFLHNPVNSFMSLGPEVFKAVLYLYVLIIISLKLTFVNDQEYY